MVWALHRLCHRHTGCGIVDYIAWGWPIALVMTLLILSLVFSGASAAVALVKGLARINFWLSSHWRAAFR